MCDANNGRPDKPSKSFPCPVSQLRFGLRRLFQIVTLVAVFLSVAKSCDLFRAALFLGGLLQICYFIPVKRRRRSPASLRALGILTGLMLIWTASVEWHAELEQCARCGLVRRVIGYRCLGHWMTRRNFIIGYAESGPQTPFKCDHQFQGCDRWDSWWGLVIPIHSRTQGMILSCDMREKQTPMTNTAATGQPGSTTAKSRIIWDGKSPIV